MLTVTICCITQQMIANGGSQYGEFNRIGRYHVIRQFTNPLIRRLVT